MENIHQILPLLNTGSKRVGIVCHQKPDADALGSLLGLTLYLEAKGHEVCPVSPTNWANYLNWMPGIEKLSDYEAHGDAVNKKFADIEFIFCLDFNRLSRTRNMESLLRESAAAKILIDHHQEPETEQFAYGRSDVHKCSTAEMVYDLIVEAGDDQMITADIATCLYAGIMTDTGSFRFPSTTASAHAMVARLKETGFEHSLVHDKLFDNFHENRLRFIGHVLLHRMEVLYEYNTVLLSIPKSDIARYDLGTGDTEGLVNLPFSIEGIRMVAIVIDRIDERKWSFRSKGDVDVNVFARNYFNGGGHKNAAGGNSTDSLDNTVKHFFQSLKTMRHVLCEPNLYEDVS